jgi:hypothetical protein
VKRFVCGGIALLLIPVCPLQAQSPTGDELKAKINDLKSKIFEARMAQQLFVNGLRFCNELDGTNFYFAPRNRVINLEDYHRSLDNLAASQAFNAQTRRPWSVQDAQARWEEAKKQAVTDKQNCALVADLPEFQKRLQELQQDTAASTKPEKRE